MAKSGDEKSWNFRKFTYLNFSESELEIDENTTLQSWASNAGTGLILFCRLTATWSLEQ